MNNHFRLGLAFIAVIAVVFVLGTVPTTTNPAHAQNPAAPNACPTPIKKNWRIKGNCGTTASASFLGTTDNQPLVFKTNNSERMRLAENGNLGIGTTSPAAKLHIAGAEEGLRLQGPASGAPNSAFVSWNDSSGTAIGYVGDASYGDTDTYLTSYVSNVHIYTPAGGVLMAGANGRVGIGTTSPDAKLTVRGEGNTVGTFSLMVRNSDGTLLLAARDNGLVYIGPLGASTTTHACLHTTADTSKYFVGCSSAAEYVPTIDSGKGYPETADLVSIVPVVKNPYGDTHGPFTVQKSAKACDTNLLGFIVKPESGADGAKLNDHYLPLAIYGYFPAKVTMENGAIKRGDPITSSSKAGYGMKATSACKVIGYALEDANAEGTIQVFADSGENAASEVVTLRGQLNTLTQENIALKQSLAAIEARLAALEQTAPLARNTTFAER